MTFSNNVKKELSELKINSKLEALIELSSILKMNASISIRNAFININFVSESEYVIRRIYKLVEYLYSYESSIGRYANNNIMKDGLYNLIIEDDDISKRILNDSGIDIFGIYTTKISKLFSRIKSLKERGYSSFLRGVFLGAGSIVDPQKSYHLEMVITSKEDLELINRVLNQVNIEVLFNIRKEKGIIYIKNSDIISNFLLVIQATNSMLKFENIRVEKDVRNNINRRMNFDIANINKTIETSMKQILDINLVEEKGLMPEDLKELAKLRKENPDYSLQKIANMLNPPISKSSVAYKMNKIKNIAKKIKNT